MLPYRESPRTRVVPFNLEGHPAEMRKLLTLPQLLLGGTVRQMIDGDQLAVSQDGQVGAYVIQSNPRIEQIVHSEIGALPGHFMRNQQGGARILQVGPSHVLAWGRTRAGPCGLWLLSHAPPVLIQEMEQIVQEQTVANGRLIKGNNRLQAEDLYLTPWGIWPLSPKAIVADCHEGLCAIEELEGTKYAYHVTVHGVQTFQPFKLYPGEYPVGIVQWQGRLMMAVRRGTQSWLTEVAATGADGKAPMRLPIDGDLLGLWSSPRGHKLAMLYRPRGSEPDDRRLQLSDGRVIHEGAFELDPTSLSWSPNEAFLGALITDLKRTRQFMIGPHWKYPLPRPVRLRELLINDRGKLVAYIRSDGQYDQIVLGTKGLSKVPIAWNLHHGPDGAIRWTTVHAEQLLTWTHMGHPGAHPQTRSSS